MSDFVCIIGRTSWSDRQCVLDVFCVVKDCLWRSMAIVLDISGSPGREVGRPGNLGQRYTGAMLGVYACRSREIDAAICVATFTCAIVGLV